MRVADTTPPALSHQETLICQRKITKHFEGFAINHRRAHGYPYHSVFTGSPGFVASRAGLAIAGFYQRLEAKIDKGIKSCVSQQEDTATLAAITAIGTAAGHKLFASETQAAVAAFAGFDADGGFINKLHGGGKLSGEGARAVRDPGVYRRTLTLIKRSPANGDF